MTTSASIRVRGARQHNLKNIDVDIARGALTVITGPSGSGKSSLAFDTIFAEGQRRYVESLSTYARQFFEQLPKPDVDRIDGLPPTIAIEQRGGAAGPRSTVATTTDIFDFLRILYARLGRPICPKCDRTIERQSTQQVVDAVLSMPEGRRIMVLAPLVESRRGGHQAVLRTIRQEGFVRARIDGQVHALDDMENLPANKKHTIEVVVDRLAVKATIKQRLADSIEVAGRLANGRVIITEQTGSDQWNDTRFTSSLACAVHPDVTVPKLTPQLFSFNAPEGACEKCHGLGTTMEFDPELIVPDTDVSLADGAIGAWRNQGKSLNAEYAKLLNEFCRRFDTAPDIPFRNLPKRIQTILLDGTAPADVEQFGASFEGVIPSLQRRWESTGSEKAKQKLHGYLGESPCEACSGARLGAAALCVKIDDRHIVEITRMTIGEATVFFTGLSFDGEARVIAEPLLREIRERLHFLSDAGVEYLTLDRATTTLSGGEHQRIRLATQIGSGLSGVCYVLDEPTIGLHPRDTLRLLGILDRLAAMDNTVVVVEHDEQIINGATHMIEIGPGAGADGGRVIAQGTRQTVLGGSESITAKYLSGERSIPTPEKRRVPDFDHAVELRGVTANNLKGVTVRFPLGCLVCVTGVSGSGKSTLVSQVLVRALRRRIDRSGPKPGSFERIVGSHFVDRIIEVDQSPIGRTPRSNPATYVGLFDLIRRLFAQTSKARIRGYGPARFSFNVKGGRCEFCEGQGTRRISMHFLPDVFVTCGHCQGRRYNRETLEIRYRGKSIADVLDMRVQEADHFFENFAKISRLLKALKDVGLGYVTLGQPSNTLSGGEAQRVKLAAELQRGGEGHTLYVLDEPTTGLHFTDVQHLLSVLNRLADRGQSLIVIEHHPDVIRAADWVIDLGPEGGEAGGRIVVEGTPEQIAECADSHTGQFLSARALPTPEALGAGSGVAKKGRRKTGR